MRKLKIIFFSLSIILSVFAQDLNKVDLSKLTPEQVAMYKKYMATSGTVSSTAVSDYEKSIPRKLSNDSLDLITPKITKNKIFGSYLFNSQHLTFEPELNIPTPSNYVLGTYDEVLVDISGLYEANYKLKVNTEGNIRIPNVGPLKVAGRTIEDATRKIRTEISKVYQGIASGETRVNISLGNIRSIRVTVVGEAIRPGNYTLPSLATAFNAIYACGGPNEIGSMRNIKVIRSGKVVASLDVYGFLIDNLQIHNIALHDDDIIRIEPYQTRVKVGGAVKREGIFEGKSGENIQEFINYSGGFLDEANKTKVTVFRITDNGKTSIDVPTEMFKSFVPQSGDSLGIATHFENKQEYKVTISGAVNMPGEYYLSENIKLKDLLVRAKGFTEMALKDSIELIRAIKDSKNLQNTDTKSIVLKYNVDDELNILNADNEVYLQNGDQVVVRTIPGFEDVRMVRVEGEIKLPGNYNIRNKSERVSDLIKRAGGFTNYAYPASAYLIRSETPDEIERKLNKIVQKNTLNQLENKQSGYIDANLLKASGANSIDALGAVDSLQKKLSGAGVADKIFNVEGVVGLNLEEIMENQGCKSDLKLEPGDIVYIPREQQMVHVLGQVLFPTIICYDNNFKLKDYVMNSGGFAERANKNNIFVLYANGNVLGTKSFLGFKTYPKIEPGSRIIIPEKPIEIKNKLTIGETVGILSSTTSVLVLVYTLLRKS